MRRRIRNRRPAVKTRATAGLVTVAICAALLSGCGGSSKPGYCSAVSNLKSSIKALPSTDVVSGGLNALQASVSKVQTDAQAVINAAQSDFPSESSALKSSVTALTDTAKQLKSGPSTATLVQLPGEISAVVTAVTNFENATSSKCG